MDILNRRFGNLIVVSIKGLNKRNERLFECQCDCGGKKIVKFFNLNSGKTKSCGCLKTGKNVENLIGQTFNRLEVIEYIGQSKHRESIWLCKCECGTYKNFLRKNLIFSKSKSCGCFNREQKTLLKGNLNHNFKPYLTDEERKNHRKTKKWSEQVKKEFDYKCDVCVSENELCAHHLNGYVWDIENRLNVSNGVCLCKNCHINFHRIYGYNKVNENQYKEFKEKWKTRL